MKRWELLFKLFVEEGNIPKGRERDCYLDCKEAEKGREWLDGETEDTPEGREALIAWCSKSILSTRDAASSSSTGRSTIVARRLNISVKKRWYSWARSCWKTAFGDGRETPSFLVAVDRLFRWFDNWPGADADQVQAMFASDAGFLTSLGTAYWAHYGFQVVQPGGHSYADALMATTPPDDIRAPWPAFLIELPAGLLFTTMAGLPAELTHVLVTCLEEEEGKFKWSFLAAGPSGVQLWRMRLPLNVLRGPVADTSSEIDGFFNLGIDSRDERLLALLTRLVLNLCVAMTASDTPVRKLGKSHRSVHVLGRVEKEPKFRVYRVGKPVKVRVREQIERYLEQGCRSHSPPTVQFLVCGHWRNQPHGPRHSLRRKQWIEPHWKGRFDVPINVRPHVVGPKDLKEEGNPQ